MTFWGKLVAACVVGVIMGFAYLFLDSAVSYGLLGAIIVLGPMPD